MQNLFVELVQHHENMDGTDVAAMSHADYLTLLAAFVLEDMGGPSVLMQLQYGRKDVKAEDANLDVPKTGKTLIERLEKAGLSEQEQVAFSSIMQFYA